MCKHLIRPGTRADRFRRGFTLMEMLTVIGIIAIVCAIAIPGIFAVSRALRFRQRNDAAESIFLAAQSNLTELRSSGALRPLQMALDSDPHVIPDTAGFPSESWSGEYVYVSSDDADEAIYNMVLPVNGIEGSVRDKNVIIEFNPYTANVYAVFYSENDTGLTASYQAGLPRDDEDARKRLMLGYYCGSGLGSAQLELEKSQAIVKYSNGEEGTVTVRIPVPELYYSKLDEFVEGLQVDLTVQGDLGGEFTLRAKEPGNAAGCTIENGNSVLVRCVIDSLRDTMSFANFSAGTAGGPAVTPMAAGAPHTGQPLTAIESEQETFYGTANPPAGAAPVKILPGDNVTVTAGITYIPQGSNPSVTIEPGILSGVNPMFHTLQKTAGDKYVLSVSNGRNLQNLNALAPSLGIQVETVYFEDDIFWNKTAEYYNETYGVDAGSGKRYENAPAEAPARALPYFVPIHSDALFGTARFIFPGENDGGLGGILGQIIKDFTGFLDDLLNFQPKIKVPTLTDSLDLAMQGKHAAIQGNGHGVYFLNINANRYQAPAAGRFYASKNQVIDYDFTGLFGYVNTTVDNLNVVNPIIRGHGFDDGAKQVPVYKYFPEWSWEHGFYYPVDHYETVSLFNNPATGALVGAAGFDTLITNCGVYIDTAVPGFTRAAMTQGDFETADQTWYGVSGEGAVGGLVGYAKSHRIVTGDLVDDTDYLAFSRAFAAVPVSGNMRGTGDKDFGYSNGVGGLLGNSQLTNFYNCYASGSVRANKAYLRETTGLDAFLGNMADKIAEDIGVTLDIPYNGRTGQGVGGFVGTSHGTRYTNCFATGDVQCDSINAPKTILCSGGFVGVMSLDETLTFGNDSLSTKVAQRSIFTDCYSVGLATVGGTPVENFSGANSRVKLTLDQAGAYAAGDYYRLYAPCQVFGSREPSYTDLYIFRNSYYLSKYNSGAQDNSNSCANPETYGTLANLPGNHASESWRTQQIQKIKEVNLYKKDHRIPLVGTINIQVTYDHLYFGGYNFQSPITGIVYEIFPSHDPWMTNRYHELYATGYQDGWEPANSENTHSYNMGGAGSRYPFSKLAGMDYYGDWPGMPSAAGLAYYETYEGEGADQLHCYFDRDKTSTLRSDETTTVVADGYAVLAASEHVTAAVNDGEPVTLTNTSAFSSGSSSYHVFPLTDDLMRQAAEGCKASGSFYAKLTVSDNGEFYTAYFNPNVALTQVNPDSESRHARKPDGIPAQLYIRSARQLAALGAMDYAWSDAFHYVQQLHVNFAKYRQENLGLTASVGSETAPFAGSYDGSLGYVKQAAVDGLRTKFPLFGTVAPEGSVRNLDVKASRLTIAPEKAGFAAVLAADLRGTLEHVNLTLSDEVTVTAQKAAGLLAGTSSGTLSKCTVLAEKPLTLQAESAGIAVGSITGGSADTCSVTTGAVTKFSGARSGGFAGSAADAEFSQVELQLASLSSQASAAGGFAGRLNGGSAKEIRVSLMNGDYTAAENGTFGGFAASLGADRATAVQSTQIYLDRTSRISAGTAAGFVCLADHARISTLGVNLEGTLTGTQAAAGFAGALGKDASCTQASVWLSGKALNAPRAAGFANTLTGKAAHSSVILQKGSIAGAQEAAGFANTLSGTAENGLVSGAGSVTGAKAAGFANTLSSGSTVTGSAVTPVEENKNESYAGASPDALRVEGSEQAAGFACSVAKKASLSSSEALCSLSAGASGFVGSNEGTVSGCTANVRLPSGHGFAGTNTGTVDNCYGWFGGSESLAVTREEMGSCRSSYFVNLDVAETDESPDNVVFFDRDGKLHTMKPSALAEEARLAELNPEGKTIWFPAGTLDAFPFREALSKTGYLYPMLRTHHGDWSVPPRYPYGAAYFERYEDGSWRIRTVDLSDPSVTVDGKLLSGFYTGTAEGLTLSDTDVFGTDGIIAEAGYALFCKAGRNPFPAGLLGQQLPDAPVIPGIAKLPLYRLVTDETELVLPKAPGGSVTVSTGFAHGFDVGENPQVIRTPEQLSHMTSGGSFLQTHDISGAALPALDRFTGTYDGTGRTLSAAAAPWMKELTGSVTNLSLTLTGTLREPVFGSLTGNLSLKKISLETAEANLIQQLGGSFACPTVAALRLNAPLFGKTAPDTVLENLTLTAESSAAGSCIVEEAEKLTMKSVTVSVPSVVFPGGEVCGVLAGRLTGGKLENCTVSGTDKAPTVITVTGQSGKTSLAGGLVGSSTGELAGCTVSADIRYLQPEQADAENAEGKPVTESAILGGIAGEASGVIRNTEASGSITLLAPEPAKPDPTDPSDPSVPNGSLPTDPSVPDNSLPPAEAVAAAAAAAPKSRIYTVGGAIGQDLGGSFQGVRSTVRVAKEWAFGDGTATPIQPAGLGAVGKFVGHVSTGTFANCSGLDGSDSGFLFLGSLESSRENTDTLKPQPVYGSPRLFADGTELLTKPGETVYEGFTLLENKEYFTYPATLEQCSFDAADGSQMLQRIDPEEYFYSMDSEKELRSYTAADAAVLDQPRTLRYSDFSGSGDICTDQPTAWFYQDPEDGHSYNVRITITEPKRRHRTYELFYFANETRKPIISHTFKRGIFSDYDFNVDIGSAHGFSRLNLTGTYLLVSNGQLLTVSDGAPVLRPFAETFFGDSSFLWSVSADTRSASFGNSGLYLQADGSLGESALLPVDAVQGNVLRLGDREYRLFTALEGTETCRAAFFQPIPDASNLPVFSQVCVTVPRTPEPAPAGIPGGDVPGKGA